jgi:hypothetical protein
MLNWLGFAVPMQRRERTPHHKHHPQVPRKGPALLTQDERAGRSDIRATLATFEVELEGQIPTSLESLTLRQRRSTSAAASSTPKTTLSQAVRGQDVAVFANAGTIVQENNNVSIQTLVCVDIGTGLDLSIGDGRTGVGRLVSGKCDQLRLRQSQHCWHSTTKDFTR